jgi:hypothetical protein
MNHTAEVHITGESKTEGRIGLHMNATVRVVVPASASFAPPPKKLIVDSSKITVHTKG